MLLQLHRRARRTQTRTALWLYEGSESLAQVPLRVRPGRITDTCELVLRRQQFLVIYRADDDVVEILRILHNMRSAGHTKH